MNVVIGFVFAFISHSTGFLSMLDTVIDEVLLRLSVLWDFFDFLLIVFGCHPRRALNNDFQVCQFSHT